MDKQIDNLLSKRVKVNKYEYYVMDFSEQHAWINVHLSDFYAFNISENKPAVSPFFMDILIFFTDKR